MIELSFFHSAVHCVLISSITDLVRPFVCLSVCLSLCLVQLENNKAQKKSKFVCTFLGSGDIPMCQRTTPKAKINIVVAQCITGLAEGRPDIMSAQDPHYRLFTWSHI